MLLIGLDSVVPKFVEEFGREGRLPNLMGLREEGFWAEAIPTIPAITPPGWATVGTGAWPSTHGIEGFGVHFPGEPLDKVHDGFDSRLCKAQYLWEAAADAGRRCVVLKYPGTWPHRREDIVQVCGHAGYAGRRCTNDVFHSCCFATFDGDMSGHIRVEAEGGVYKLPLPVLPNVKPKTYFARIRGGRLEVARDEGFKDILFSLAPGEWSGVVTDDFEVDGRPEPAGFRAKLLELSSANFKLYLTHAHRSRGFTTPADLAEALFLEVGPFFEYTGPQDLWNGWIDPGTQLEVYKMHTDWMIEAAKFLLSRYEPEVFALQWHPIDYAQHIAWGGFDPRHPDFDPERGDFWWDWLGRVYEEADRLVGEIAEAAGEDAVICVVGDHGHEVYHTTFDVNRLLEAHGLLKRNPDGSINWAETKAFAREGIHVYVNLKGRDPEGIVEPGEEYERVREEVIEALYSAVDGRTGRHIVAFAVRREEMSWCGLYGEGVGDVIYCLREGYESGATGGAGGWGLPEGHPKGPEAPIFAPTKLGRQHTSEHGAHLPWTERMRTLFLLKGPGVRKGVVGRLPIMLVDVAPTCAEACALPIPKNAEGRVVREALEG